VIPAAWRVSLGGVTVIVRNTDPSNRNPLSPSCGLITCQGKLGGGKTLTYLPP